MSTPTPVIAAHLGVQLDLIKVSSNTTWGADRKVLLRLYRALIRSKLDYGSARPSYIKRLDIISNQGLRLY